MIQTVTIQVRPNNAKNDFLLKKTVAERLNISLSDINEMRIVKRSIDARSRDIKINLSVLTAYGDDDFLIDNELNRFCINDRSAVRFNEDGSLDIYLQAAKPEDPALVGNWLPVGGKGFHLFMRIYLPEDVVLDGSWKAPEIRKVDK